MFLAAGGRFVDADEYRTLIKRYLPAGMDMLLPGVWEGGVKC